MQHFQVVSLFIVFIANSLFGWRPSLRITSFRTTCHLHGVVANVQVDNIVNQKERADVTVHEGLWIWLAVCTSQCSMLTSSQHLSHFFLHAKGRPQTTQIFSGRFDFPGLFPLFSVFPPPRFPRNSRHIRMLSLDESDTNDFDVNCGPRRVHVLGEIKEEQTIAQPDAMLNVRKNWLWAIMTLWNDRWLENWWPFRSGCRVEKKCCNGVDKVSVPKRQSPSYGQGNPTMCVRIGKTESVRTSGPRLVTAHVRDWCPRHARTARRSSVVGPPPAQYETA